MNKIALQDLVGGALQEKFANSFEKVIKNLQDPNTPYKNKRAINITLKFQQNETRDDLQVDIEVSEKLSPQTPMKTSFVVGKNLETGDVFAEEYGKQIKGQMTMSDYQTANVDGKTVDTETGEIIEESENSGVVDFRQAKNA